MYVAANLEVKSCVIFVGPKPMSTRMTFWVPEYLPANSVTAAYHSSQAKARDNLYRLRKFVNVICTGRSKICLYHYWMRLCFLHHRACCLYANIAVDVSCPSRCGCMCCMFESRFFLIGYLVVVALSTCTVVVRAMALI